MTCVTIAQRICSGYINDYRLLTMNLHNALNPIMFVTLILGGLPLKFRGKCKRRLCQILRSNLYNIYSLTILISVLALNLHAQIYFIDRGSERSISYSAIASTVMCILSYVTAVITSYLNFGTISSSFDQFLLHRERFQIFRENYKNLRYNTIIRLVLGEIIMLAYHISAGAQFKLKLNDIRIYYSFSIIHVVVYVVCVQFIVFVLVLNGSFSSINSKLLNLLFNMQKFSEMNSDYVFCVNKVGYSTLESFENAIKYTVNSLAGCHDDLCNIARKVNIAYSVHIITHLIMTFLNLSFNFYHTLVLCAFHREETRITDFLFPVIGTFFNIFKLLQQVLYCAACSNEVSPF